MSSASLETESEVVFCGILEEETVRPWTVLFFILLLDVVLVAFISENSLPPKFGSLPNIEVSNDVSMYGQEETFTKSRLLQSLVMLISSNFISLSD